MPALLEAVADLEVEEVEILPAERAITPKRVLETVVIGPHGLEATGHAIYDICNPGCNSNCADTCCCGCLHDCLY